VNYNVQGENMQLDESLPTYPMGAAAHMLGVHPRTLRIYEAEGLINPCRRGGKRFFSHADLIWIECLRSLIHDENISIEGVKRLLQYVPCWKLKNCSRDERSNCPRFRHRGKKCWEFSQKNCEKSCDNCEVYTKKNEA
jgi:DNA-binding transcriptional MerR regulator